MNIREIKTIFYFRIMACWIIFCFIFSAVIPSCSWSQTLNLPIPGTMVLVSPAYVPVIMKGVKVHPDNPFLFDFMVDAGKSGLKIDSVEFKAEAQKLIKYFLASLTIKEGDLWVNLSPFERDRMLSEDLGKTELGRDMLAQDYVLKQLTASLIYPEKDLGRAFWARVYAKAREQFSTTDIPVDTFNKVWIKADKARVVEHNGAAYVTASHLKVMLEQDYVAGQMSRRGEFVAPSDDTGQDIAKSVLREVIVPEIEKEVNQGQNFAPLRQMFSSMILATWYKLALKDALLNQVYSDKGKTGGVLADDPAATQKIYEQYLQAYKRGVFNYIKDDLNPDGQPSVPRKYFSGGVNGDLAQVIERVDPGMAAAEISADAEGRTQASITVGVAGTLDASVKAADAAQQRILINQTNIALDKMLNQIVNWADMLSRNSESGSVSVRIFYGKQARFESLNEELSQGAVDTVYSGSAVGISYRILREFFVNRHFDGQARFNLNAQGSILVISDASQVSDATDLELRLRQSFHQGGDIVDGTALKPKRIEQAVDLVKQYGFILKCKDPETTSRARNHNQNILLAQAVDPGGMGSAVNAGADILIMSGIWERDEIDAARAAALEMGKYILVLIEINPIFDNVEQQLNLAYKNGADGIQFKPVGVKGQVRKVKQLVMRVQNEYPYFVIVIGGGVRANNRFKFWDNTVKAVMSIQGISEIRILATWAKTGSDAAAIPDARINGGIDLDAQNMELDVARDSRGINMKFDPAMITEFEKGNFTGLEGIILKIVLIQNPLKFMSLDVSFP